MWLSGDPTIFYIAFYWILMKAPIFSYSDLHNFGHGNGIQLEYNEAPIYLLHSPANLTSFIWVNNLTEHLIDFNTYFILHYTKVQINENYAIYECHMTTKSWELKQGISKKDALHPRNTILRL